MCTIYDSIIHCTGAVLDGIDTHIYKLTCYHSLLQQVVLLFLAGDVRACLPFLAKFRCGIGIACLRTCTGIQSGWCFLSQTGSESAVAVAGTRCMYL